MSVFKNGHGNRVQFGFHRCFIFSGVLSNLKIDYRRRLSMQCGVSVRVCNLWFVIANKLLCFFFSYLKYFTQLSNLSRRLTYRSEWRFVSVWCFNCADISLERNCFECAGLSIVELDIIGRKFSWKGIGDFDLNGKV